ncbi:hypothetical protein D1007_45836 [Hordeum vulgare]|nr:hypothetical protein D1007_45836 [Hordeum vulgare]
MSSSSSKKGQHNGAWLGSDIFYRGFGLPASTFFSNFLTFFGLQSHHLAPNAILQLASFVVLCEGFLGMEPRLDLWQSLFFFKQQSIKMDKAEVEKLDGPRPMTPCGATLNVNPSRDAINMPPFAIEPPMAKKNWQAKYPKPIAKVAQIGVYLEILKARDLLGRDLLTVMMTRRILPLQRRPHLIC